jgi:hypothetical protein
MSAAIRKQRTIILTASAVAITAVGAYTGALLKTDTETRKKMNGTVSEGIDWKIDRWVLW